MINQKATINIMNQETKRIILDHLNEWLEDKKLNTVDLKTSGHLPVSGRWVDSLRKSVRDKDNKGFNTDKVIELLKVLELPYFMDGSQLVVKPVLFVTDHGIASESERKEMKETLKEYAFYKPIVFIPADAETSVHCLHSIVRAANGSHSFCERCEKTLSEIIEGEQDAGN